MSRYLRPTQSLGCTQRPEPGKNYQNRQTVTAKEESNPLKHPLCLAVATSAVRRRSLATTRRLSRRTRTRTYGLSPRKRTHLGLQLLCLVSRAFERRAKNDAWSRTNGRNQLVAHFCYGDLARLSFPLRARPQGSCYPGHKFSLETGRRDASVEPAES